MWAGGAAWAVACPAVVCLLIGGPLIAGGVAGAQPSDTAEAPAAGEPGSTEIYCTPDDPGLVELSGLTVVDGTVYAVGDSGNDDRVAVLDDTCQVSEWIPNPIDPFDVEDMTHRDGRLWLADIGDNNRIRETIAMTDVSLSDRTGAVHRLTYPDGPRDAEAALLESDGRPVVVTKDPTGSTEVFTADVSVADLPSPGPTPLRRVGQFTLTSTGTEGGPPLIDGSLMVTGAAVDATGTVAALRTYTDLYLYRVGDAGIAAALVEPPAVTLPLPPQPQGEAIAFLDNGDLLVASEGGTREATQPIAVVRGAAGLVSPQEAEEPEAASSSGPSGALVIALSGTVVLIGAAVFLGRRSRAGASSADSDDDPPPYPGFDPNDPYALDPLAGVDEEQDDSGLEASDPESDADGEPVRRKSSGRRSRRR